MGGQRILLLCSAVSLALVVAALLLHAWFWVGVGAIVFAASVFAQPWATSRVVETRVVFDKPQTTPLPKQPTDASPRPAIASSAPPPIDVSVRILPMRPSPPPLPPPESGPVDDQIPREAAAAAPMRTHAAPPTHTHVDPPARTHADTKNLRPRAKHIIPLAPEAGLAIRLREPVETHSIGFDDIDSQSGSFAFGPTATVKDPIPPFARTVSRPVAGTIAPPPISEPMSPEDRAALPAKLAAMSSPASTPFSPSPSTQMPTPERAPKSTPEVGAISTAEREPKSTPEVGAISTAEREPKSTPESGAISTAERAAMSTAERGAISTAERGAISTAERAPKSTAERAPKSTAERAPKSTPESGAMSTAERAPKSTPASGAISTAERAPTSTAERAPKSTPASGAISTAERAPTSTPVAATERTAMAAHELASLTVDDITERLGGPTIKYAVTVATLTVVGIEAKRQDGVVKYIAWEAIQTVIARRLPSEAPFDGATFVDIVSTRGATLRILPWTTLVGIPTQVVGEPRARTLVNLIAARCGDAHIDAATELFAQYDAQAPQLPTLKFLAAHDERVA